MWSELKNDPCLGCLCKGLFKICAMDLEKTSHHLGVSNEFGQDFKKKYSLTNNTAYPPPDCSLWGQKILRPQSS